MIDFRTMAERIGLDEADFVEMAELFVQVGCEDLKKLSAALQQKNCNGVMVHAHSLKGASANLGFTGIYELSRGVEANAKAMSLDGAEAALTGMQALLTDISRALEETAQTR